MNSGRLTESMELRVYRKLHVPMTFSKGIEEKFILSFS